MPPFRPRLLVGGLTACAVTATGLAATAAPTVTAKAPLPIARNAAPVVLTGAQLPGWSVPAATGVAQPYPSGATAKYSGQLPGGFAVRTAHNGTILPSPVAGVPVDEVALSDPLDQSSVLAAQPNPLADSTCLDNPYDTASVRD